MVCSGIPEGAILVAVPVVAAVIAAAGVAPPDHAGTFLDHLEGYVLALAAAGQLNVDPRPVL